MTFLNNAAASASKELEFGNTSIDCTVVDGSGRRVGFSYTATNPAHFEVFGNINLRGLNVRFNRAVRYTATSRAPDGTSQPFANLSVEALSGVGGNFRTEANFVAHPTQKFPHNVLSIVAERDADLRGGNNTYITAPIYAGDTFRITSSSVLFGQVIANVFCTTNPGGGGQGACGVAGSPAEIVFVPTGENRARSFRAIAPTGGLPTFQVLSYELR
jgi:hypothetical protein